jgi:ribonuclease E
MLDDDTSTRSTTHNPSETATEAAPRRTRRRAASRPAGPPDADQAAAGATAAEQDAGGEQATGAADVAPAAASSTGAVTKAAAKRTTKKAAEKKTATKTTKKATAKKSAAKKSTKKAAKAAADASTPDARTGEGAARPDSDTREPDAPSAVAQEASTGAGITPLFQAPAITPPAPPTQAPEAGDEAASAVAEQADARDAGEAGTGTRRRRSRGGRNRRKASDDDQQSATEATPAEATAGDGKAKPKAGTPRSERAEQEQAKEDAREAESTEAGSSRRRRRRSRAGDEAAEPADKGAKARDRKSDKEAISGVEGSTRIEAKRQRRREGREAGRRRAPILSESEFLARRESVDRVMAIRQHGEKTQIAVLEDNVLVEHYVALESQGSIIGNVYLGKVQNVLPSMEAAFIDIGRGRNAVLYAGEVDWDLVPDRNAPRRIENALKPGQAVLVQVTKDPIGHKGARLTSQISLPGRYLVYVPGGGTSGISRKLPDTERTRLKTLLKEILPEDAGVIIRTAAEGASEEALTRDVNRLTARWEDIDKKVKAGQAPSALYAEPDTTLKVVRDLFTEDFSKLVISGDDAWDIVDGYVQHVAPDLADRLERHDGGGDVFADRRVDEQLAKALDRKVWLPSGGSLVIDRTEAMTVIDVNTGKFTGAGGNLEETVTKNNLEAAEEIVRQLRLRDIGGIIVIDFIDMVLESNRDLVLRRLVECLGRDRTRHQVAEVTSLGLVQMTRKRIGTGLLEAFSHACDQCQGRGVIVESEPIEPKPADETSGSKRGSGSRRSSARRRGGKSGGGESSGGESGGESGGQSSGGESGGESSGGESGGESSGGRSGGESSGGESGGGESGRGDADGRRREPTSSGDGADSRSAAGSEGLAKQEAGTAG